MNKNTTLIIGILVILALLAGAYFAFGQKTQVTDDATATTTTSQMPVVTSGEDPEPGSIHGMPAEPAAVEARKDLAGKLSVREGSIVIMKVEEQTWTDGCLGLGGPAESCLQALVEGFRVELLAEGKTYVYRTDKTGATLRAEVSQ